MCYDVSFEVSNVRELEDYFPGLIFDDQMTMDFSVLDHIQSQAFANYPIIYINREDFKPHCRLMEWSVIPHYEKDEEKFKRYRNNMANARSERIVGDKKSYWYKIRNRRCLIPVTGIFEHRGVAGWKKKVPYHISLKGQPIFFVPGLYAIVELPDKETGEIKKRYTYTLVTREAICNIVMKQIHNSKEDGEFRMPLFMTKERADDWLREGLTDEQIQEIMDYEFPQEEMDYYPVDTIRSYKPRADGKRKNQPFDWPNLPALGEMNP